MLGISWVAAQLAASQEGLSSMSEWISTVYSLDYRTLLNKQRRSIRFLRSTWRFSFCPRALTSEEIAGSFRKLYNGEKHSLCSWLSIIKTGMSLGKYKSFRREKRNSCKTFFGKPQGKRPLWEYNCGIGDNIKTNLRIWVVEFCRLAQNSAQ
jgi:hypothetical protein